MNNLAEQHALNVFECEHLQKILRAHITARQEAEMWLRKFSVIIATSPNSIVITDLNGNIEYINDTFARITGYKSNELVGQNLRILQSGQTPRATYDAMWNKLRHGQYWEGELINKRRDGSIYIEFAKISPIRQPSGMITNYVAIKEDITEKKYISNELERYHQHLEELVIARTTELATAKELAESANRAKSAFLANMSHEIRTPLTAIIGFSESLLESGSSVAERIDAINTIIRNGRHLQALLNDILDLSKIEAGQLMMEIIPTLLFDLFNEIENSHATQARAKGLNFSIDYLLPLPRIIHTDPTRLRQILFNLCGNAIKFTNHGYVRVAVNCDREQEKLVVSIFDTGLGLTNEQRDRLFKPFTQGDASITRRHGGTGLGLNISRHLAERLGGTITVESTPGSGSLFVAVVATGPLDTIEWIENQAQWRIGQENSQIREKPIHFKRLGGLVLLAEDTPDNQRLIVFFLRRAGVAVQMVDNGQDAVEQALIGEFNLILMDMQMPIMDGLSATTLLRQAGFSRPIVALTANAGIEDRHRCLEAGCTDFLAKPVDWDQFYTILSNYLPTEQQQCANLASAQTLAVDPEYQAMMTSFRKELPNRLNELAHASTNAEWDNVRRLAHQLKGVATSFGMPQVTRIAADLEFQAIRGSARDIFSLLSDLRMACSC